MPEFTGFTSETFDTYAPDKWSSNVHNLKRMRIKDAMLALAERAQKSLQDDLAGLSRAASDEIPNIVNHKKVDSQWVYWFRDAKAREALASFLEKIILNQANIFNIAAQDKHITLAVILRQEGLWVGLRMAAGATVDRRNLTVKLSKAWERERFMELLSALPEGARMGLEGQEIDAASMTLEGLEACAAQLAEDITWSIGHTIVSADAITLGGELADQIGRWIGALVPLYRYTAWTRENDFIEAGKQLQEEKQQKRRNTTSFNPGDKVKITAGLFSGKTGVVQETDTKAQVKVMVGSMSVVVASNDLTVARA